MREIIIRKPDDMHLHLRSGEMLRTVLPCTSGVFARGVVMGNLPKAVTTAADAKAYREEILAADRNFQPIMTIMLNKLTTPEIVAEACRQGIRVLKYIPDSVSTNSEGGVALTELEDYYSVLKTAEELGMVFSGHWESLFNESGAEVPEIEREGGAIRFLDEVVRVFPKLIIVAEHASTKKMIEYVKSAPANVGATLTLHHALLTYEDVCDAKGRIWNPFNYCKPIAKTTEDRNAVVMAMISGNPKFFFGSDSAPHPLNAKSKTPPSAGIFTAPVAVPLLYDLFEGNNSSSKFEDFMSKFGAERYRLPLNNGNIIIKKGNSIIPDSLGEVRLFRGGRLLGWRVENYS